MSNTSHRVLAATFCVVCLGGFAALILLNNIEAPTAEWQIIALAILVFVPFLALLALAIQVVVLRRRASSAQHGAELRVLSLFLGPVGMLIEVFRVTRDSVTGE